MFQQLQVELGELLQKTLELTVILLCPSGLCLQALGDMDQDALSRALVGEGKRFVKLPLDAPASPLAAPPSVDNE